MIGFIQHPVSQKALGAIYALLIAFVTIITQNIHSLMVCIFLVVFFMVGDFFTGIFASKRALKKSIESSKLRWSCAKYAVYCFFIIGTLIIGVSLHMVDCFSCDVSVYTKTKFLQYTLNFIQAQMIFVTWIEAVSIVENVRRVYPENTYLKGLHYILVVDVKKIIPQFTRYLKEEKSKDLDKLIPNDNEKEITDHP